MKLFAAVVMCIALYLLYRIAYPKSATRNEDKRSDRLVVEHEEENYDVVGKSRFVSTVRSEPTTAKSEPTTTIALKSDDLEDAPTTFVLENPKNTVFDIVPVVPDEDLDELFNPTEEIPAKEELTKIEEGIEEVPLESEEDVEEEEEEDTEEEGFSQDVGSDGRIADGLSFEQLGAVKKVVDNPPDEVTAEMAETLSLAVGSDMFEDMAKQSALVSAASKKGVNNISDVDVMEAMESSKLKIAALIEKHSRPVQIAMEEEKMIEDMEKGENKDTESSDQAENKANISKFLGM
jgi:hypothetical protein